MNQEGNTHSSSKAWKENKDWDTAAPAATDKL